MIGQFRLQRSLQDCFGELFQQAVLADDVFRLLVIGQQLINEGLVDSHRFLILLFRWSFTQLLLQLLATGRLPLLRLFSTLLIDPKSATAATPACRSVARSASGRRGTPGNPSPPSADSPARCERRNEG